MPTAEADVAFGLGRFDLSEDEVRTRVYSSLDAVGMSEYAQVRNCVFKALLFSESQSSEFLWNSISFRIL